MSSRSIEFPIRRRRSLFGSIVDPRILLEVRTTAGYRGHRFLLDTGAEISVVPRRLAAEVGLDWDRLPVVDITGVGPGRVPTKAGSLMLRIGGIDVSIRCLFLDQRDAPYILGCADVLDRFALTIDAELGKIILSEIP